MLDNLTEKCAVFAVVNHKDALKNTLFGLHALQHRGHDGFGIASRDKTREDFYTKCFEGVVGENIAYDFKHSDHTVIGHNRYATSGTTKVLQPIYVRDEKFGDVALAHNGNLVNTEEMLDFLKNFEIDFKSDVDSEILLHYILNTEGSSISEKLYNALPNVKGAFSVIMLSNEHVFAFRDRYGIRPLVLGKLDASFVLSSETCALKAIMADFVREIDIGEIVSIDDNNGILSSSFLKEVQKDGGNFCLFEYIYFSRPDSEYKFGSVYNIRKDIGKLLAIDFPVDADVVVPVPDSGNIIALGYAEQSAIKLDFGIIKNGYISRTFIEGDEANRDIKLKMKHNVNKSVLDGKRVIVIDDSIVRGNTLKTIVSLLYQANVKEIHLRIASPRMLYSCFYGVDTPKQEDLFSFRYTEDEMCKYFSVKSLHFIELDRIFSLFKGINNTENNNMFCDACFTGKYLF